MQTDFPEAIEFVLRMEGGYSNDSNDSGGETMFGISRVNFPKWEGWTVVDAAKVLPGFPGTLNGNATLQKSAQDFYMNNFWNVCHCDELPSSWAISVFDCAVNDGTTEAIGLLQIALDVNVDHIIGSQTIAAAFKATTRQLLKFFALRQQHYTRIIIAKPKDEVFDLNWAFRVMSLLKLVYTGTDQ